MEYNIVINTLIYIYGISGIITFIGFIPTMLDLWNKKPSANIQTYIIWIITATIALIYGILILKDPMFIIVISIRLLAFTIYLILRLRIKKMKLIKNI